MTVGAPSPSRSGTRRVQNSAVAKVEAVEIADRRHRSSKRRFCRREAESVEAQD